MDLFLPHHCIAVMCACVCCRDGTLITMFQSVDNDAIARRLLGKLEVRGGGFGGKGGCVHVRVRVHVCVFVCVWGGEVGGGQGAFNTNVGVVVV